MNAMRKVRKDAILHGLPLEQRQKVDGWLFDKGLTYQAVAQACGSVFGAQVSRSSVARYHERRMREELRRKRKETIRREVEGIKEEERYELLLTRMGDLALEGAEEWKGRRGWRWIIEITKLLIAARREQNERMMVMVMRKKFEMWAAKACLKQVWLARKNGQQTFNARRESADGGQTLQDGTDLQPSKTDLHPGPGKARNNEYLNENRFIASKLSGCKWPRFRYFNRPSP